MKRPSRHSEAMMEGCTHCNVDGHVVPATLVSWLLLRPSALRVQRREQSGTEVAPHCSARSRCPLFHVSPAGHVVPATV